MTVYPALTESDLLRDVSPAEMPPPFRHLTPLKAERVARDLVDGVLRGRTRIVAPRRANMLLLGDALSSRLGDWIARALAQRALARILRLSSGKTYHEAIGATSRRSGSSAPNDVTDQTLAWFGAQRPPGPDGFGLATIMGSGFAEMTANLARNLREGRLRIAMGVFAASLTP